MTGTPGRDVPQDTLTAALATPVLFRCRVRHERREGVRHTFENRYPTWLVDLDDIPRAPALLRRLTSFRAGDHLGDPRRTVRSNVDTFLAANGIDLAGGRVLMLAQARTFGHVFDPLSLFWCHDRSGTLVCVIAEVRNTYGQRYCYLLPPGQGAGTNQHSTGRAEMAKKFYVSPFFTVDGRYLVRWTLTPRRVSVTFVLRRTDARGEHTALVATLSGESTPGARLVSTALAHPLSGWAISAAIHYEALRLRRLGLPLRRRRRHLPQPGVAPPAPV